MPSGQRKTHHLYDIFDRLVLSNGADSPPASSIAVWHVPNPGLLLSQANRERTEQLPQHDNRNRQPGLVKQSLRQDMVHEITFSELRMAATRLAARLAQELDRLSTRKSPSTVAVEEVNSSTQSTEAYRSLVAEQANTVVALFMPPGIDRIVAQIACMKLRLAYLPVDRQLSVGRIVQLIESVRPAITIVAQAYYTSIFYARSRTESVSEVLPTGPQESWQNEPVGDSFPSSKLESLHKTLDPFFVVTYEGLAQPSTPEDGMKVDGGRGGSRTKLFETVIDPVVILLSTSGSTSSGPKVARLRNSQLVNRLQWQWDTNMKTTPSGDWAHSNSSGCTGPGISLASTAWVFIDAFTQLFSALFAGWPVVVPGASDCASEVCVSDAHILVNLIHSFKVAYLTTVPLQLNTWLQQLRLMPRKEQDYQMDSLRTVVVSGDLLRPKLAADFFELFGNGSVRLVNLYGTTELAGDVTAAIFHNREEVWEATNAVKLDGVPCDQLKTSHILTVGRPIDNCSVYIIQRGSEKTSNNSIQCRQCTGRLAADKPGDLSSSAAVKAVATVSLATDNGRPTIDWKALNCSPCTLGQVGEVAVVGVPVSTTGEQSLPTWSSNQAQSAHRQACSMNGRECNMSAQEIGVLSPEKLTKSALSHVPVDFPGDLGFICPTSGLIFIYGRSDELVKINAVKFLACDVDRLVEKIKEDCLRCPEKLPESELKLLNVDETVTLAVTHPIQGIKQLVCFYTVRSTHTTVTYRRHSYGEKHVGLTGQGSVRTATIMSAPSEKHLHLCDTSSSWCDDQTEGHRPHIPSVVEWIEETDTSRNTINEVCIQNSFDLQDSDNRFSCLEFSSILANHLPVYIKPIFVRVSRIPVLPTSQKVDKAKLRHLYERHMTGKAVRRSDAASRPSIISSFDSGLSDVDRQANGHRQEVASQEVVCSRSTQEVGNREKARQILANVLRLVYTVEQPRPRDEEDFYVLGGDSLMAVIAVDSFRQAGFTVKLETFYQTSRIGDIIESLMTKISTMNVNPRDAWNTHSDDLDLRADSLDTFEANLLPTFELQFGKVTISFEEWTPKMWKTRHGEDKSITYEKITAFLVQSFLKKDIIARVFGLGKDDLRLAASTYVNAALKCNGILLVALSKRANLADESITGPSDLIGVLLSVPSRNMPSINVNSRLELLEKYFDFSSTNIEEILNSETEKGLSVVMVGITPPTKETNQVGSSSGEWLRLTLKTLFSLEGKLLQVAANRGFTYVDTLNTTQITKEVCTTLGYKIIKSTSMGLFKSAENVNLDKGYESICSYHMFRLLEDQHRN